MFDFILHGERYETVALIVFFLYSRRSTMSKEKKVKLHSILCVVSNTFWISKKVRPSVILARKKRRSSRVGNLCFEWTEISYYIWRRKHWEEYWRTKLVTRRNASIISGKAKWRDNDKLEYDCWILRTHEELDHIGRREDGLIRL